jgi:hypothetical protein
MSNDMFEKLNEIRPVSVVLMLAVEYGVDEVSHACARTSFSEGGSNEVPIITNW